MYNFFGGWRHYSAYHNELVPALFHLFSISTESNLRFVLFRMPGETDLLS